MRQATEFKLVGRNVGTIWWPTGEEFEKEVSYPFLRNRDRAFYGNHEDLRDAVLHVTNDGDFQACRFDGSLKVTRRSATGYRVRYFPVNLFPSVADSILA